MMSKFDIGDFMRSVGASVSELDTETKGREQIEYIDIAQIDDDPNNFYQLSNLDELAANIEMLGLQQPIRVRGNPEDARRVIIVSGHRRRAAIRQLVESGREDLREIPCIREQTAGSEALQELRLIYANSDTRHLTSAEISKQAERVEALLYQLKEEGYDFPGRMRDHVAEACKVSKTKLATLKVIRDKLIPEWHAHYEDGSLAESTAYTIAKMPAAHQLALHARVGKKSTNLRTFYESEANRYGEKMAEVEGKACPKRAGETCGNVPNKLCRICNRADDYMFTTPCAGCCAKCEYLSSCGYSCDLCAADKQAAKELKKQAKQAEQEAEKRRNAEQAEKDKDAIQILSRMWDFYDQKKAELGFSDDEYAHATGIKVWMLRRDKTLSKYSRTPVGVDGEDLMRIKKAAEFFGITTDQLLSESDTTCAAVCPSAADWVPVQFVDGHELPTRSGMYYCRFDCEGTIIKQPAWWDGILDIWCFKDGGAKIDAKCLGWFPLPEDDEE